MEIIHSALSKMRPAWRGLAINTASAPGAIQQTLDAAAVRDPSVDEKIVVSIRKIAESNAFASDVPRRYEDLVGWVENLTKAYDREREENVEWLRRIAGVLVPGQAPGWQDVLDQVNALRKETAKNSAIASSPPTPTAPMNKQELTAIFQARLAELQSQGLSYDAAFSNASEDPRYNKCFDKPAEESAEKIAENRAANERASAVAAAVNSYQKDHPGCDYDTAWNAVQSDLNMRHVFDAMKRPEGAR